MITLHERTFTRWLKVLIVEICDLDHSLRMLQTSGLRALVLAFLITTLLPRVLFAQESQSNPSQKEAAVSRSVSAAPPPPPPSPSSPPAAPLQNGSVAIDAYVVAGGGGSSSSGSFSLSGTIGQAAAGGPLTGGSFSLNGGFWGEIQTQSTPTKKRGGQITSQ